MAVVSVPIEDVEVGELVHTDHGWFPVIEKVLVAHEGFGVAVLILDHPDHGVSSVDHHLLGIFRNCVVSRPQHMTVSVQV